MFRRILLSAVGAGLAVGIVTAMLQHFTTSPLIVAAEVFEDGAGHHHAAEATGVSSSTSLVLVQQSAQADAPGQAWEPANGAERIFHTSLATVLLGIGAALMLLAAMVVKGTTINGRSGLAWGAAGFAAVSLAPALGLPPELPGSAAGDLAERQIWWVGTAIATAIAIGLLAHGRSVIVQVLAIPLIAAPHIIGAPQPEAFTSTAPAELAGHFAASSLVVAAVFWVLLGWASGTLFGRFGADPPAPA